MQTYLETLHYIATKLGTNPPSEDAAKEGIDLVIDKAVVACEPGPREGSLALELPLGLLLHPIRESHLEELLESNFLGMVSGGCSLCLDESGTLLSVKTVTTPGTTSEESWQWLHRLLCVGVAWMEKVGKWEEFVPLTTLPKNQPIEGTKI